MISINDINSYLFYGYVPHADKNFLEKIVKAKHLRGDITDMSSLVADGAIALRDTFVTLATDKGRCATHVVPLSGGLDSRAILGGLLGCVDPTTICTVTFGSPGAWDYEVGRLVAQKMGIYSEHIDLTSSTWNWRTEDLVETAKELQNPIWIFDKYINNQIVRRFDGSGVWCWTGFMGDPIAGSHLRQYPSTSWENANKYFREKNRFSKDFDLFASGYASEAVLPSEPFCSENILTFDEQLDFAVRQAGPIQQVVAPNDQKYIAPFLNERWVSFILNVPFDKRIGQSLYKEIIIKQFPALFSLPTKTNMGQPITATAVNRYFNRCMLAAQSLIWKFQGKNLLRTRSINYIDFDQALRVSGEFQNMAKENLSDLNRRRVCDWLNIDEIWSKHIDGKQDLSRPITQLVSLEIYLKSVNGF